jgi:hypothetical protein
VSPVVTLVCAAGFSPTSTATSLAATPMFNQPWPGQQQQQHSSQQQHQQHSLLSAPTAAAAAAARLARRGSRGHSHMSGYSQMSGYSAMSSLDGGLSREERQHSADGAGWGRLSGVNTPGGYHTPSRCCSEAQTPHGFDADRAAVLREGSAAASGGEPGRNSNLLWPLTHCSHYSLAFCQVFGSSWREAI